MQYVEMHTSQEGLHSNYLLEEDLIALRHHRKTFCLLFGGKTKEENSKRQQKDKFIQFFSGSAFPLATPRFGGEDFCLSIVRK